MAKNCLKCNEKIPNLVVINGRQRNLQNRKYCLNCSPFGLHNTRKIDHVRQEGKELICRTCNKTFLYSRLKGVTTTHCGSCITTSRRKLIKDRAVKYKGGKCHICGYNVCMSALSFHHINPETKSFGIGSNYNKAWETVKKELDKCVLLCHNCHAEFHDGLVSI